MRVKSPYPLTPSPQGEGGKCNWGKPPDPHKRAETAHPELVEGWTPLFVPVCPEPVEGPVLSSPKGRSWFDKLTTNGAWLTTNVLTSLRREGILSFTKAEGEDSLIPHFKN